MDVLLPLDRVQATVAIQRKSVGIALDGNIQAEQN
jgi:hypothetical protein